MSQPDLRTKEGAVNFIGYKAPDTEERRVAHGALDFNFKQLLEHVWEYVPDGPGKTRFIHALNRARMEANSAIANEGA